MNSISRETLLRVSRELYRARQRLVRAEELAILNVDPFPSEESRIDGPSSRPEQHQSRSYGREKDACAKIASVCDRTPYREHDDHDACDGRPQPRYEKRATGNCQAIENQ